MPEQAIKRCERAGCNRVGTTTVWDTTLMGLLTRNKDHKMWLCREDAKQAVRAGGSLTEPKKPEEPTTKLRELDIEPPDSAYIEFIVESTTDKTVTWAVRSIRTLEVLGRVKWFGRWRQYTFYPQPETVWNTDCLQDISDFLDEANVARRLSRTEREG